GGDVGHVDVEKHRLAEGRPGKALDQLERHADGALKMLAGLAGEGHRDRRNAEQIAFDRGGDGAGVDRVVAHVGAEIHSGDDDIRCEIEQSGHRDVHAIGGCAVNGVVAIRGAAHHQRPVEGERVRGPRAVALRGDDRDLAEPRQGLRKQGDTRREVTVVVGDENFHANDSTVGRTLNRLAKACLRGVRYALTALLFVAGPAAAKLDYRVEIDAPRELKQVLEKGLNIVRWRGDPEMDDERLKRLVDEAIRESREAAATEGYFSAHVQAEVDSSAEPWVVRLRVEPGERTRVKSVDIRFSGPVTSDGEARPYLERARDNWTLRRGEPFRQAEWESAKRQAVRELAGFRYAAASIAASEAHIDPETHSATLSLEIASGPAFRFGEMRITGTRRYDDALIANLAPVHPGDVYDREKLILFQRRLLETGYFASVQAEIDQQPNVADAAPLRVAVIEAPQHHVEGGISYNTDVGPRLEARYTNQDVLSSAWRFGSTLNLDQKIQNLQLDLNTPPREGAIWDTLFTRARKQDIQNDVTREIAIGVSHNYGASAAPSALIVSAHAEDERIGDVLTSNAHAVY